MNQRIKLVLQIILTVFLAWHLIAFIGILLTGIRQLTMIIGRADVIIGFLLMAFGIIFSLLVIKYGRIIFQKDWDEKAVKWLKNNEKQFLISLVVLVLMYMLRFEISSILLYLGHQFGSFVAMTSRLEYLRIMGLDLKPLGYLTLAWVFQWYFIYYVLTIIMRLISRFRRKKS